jgi:saccharopine dehydrogenase (NAD+, L-lysine forming)
MSATIGIRHEDKYEMERRTPLSPRHVEMLIKKHNLNIVVQTSDRRIFPDHEYIIAGARVQSSLSECEIIFGVKEISEELIEPGKTYILFSHVIKGQLYNMGMLRKMIKLGCNLIDYERISDDQNKRLIFFGKYAGLAGMINTLWSLGRRMEALGYEKNPFISLKQAHQYASLEQAKNDISHVGQEISKSGIPDYLNPLTIGITGYGNVSSGVQEILSLLPVIEITPEQLLELDQKTNTSSNFTYKVVFKEHHLSIHKNGNNFDIQDYYTNPGNYKNNFEQYIPHLRILMNCMYWDERYPKLFTRNFAKEIFISNSNKMIVVGDITCDPNGSVEFTHTGTTIEKPVYIYNPVTEVPFMGFNGDGIAVMAVENLPSELPREASEAFGDVLVNFVNSIAETDFSKDFSDVALPQAIRKALILHQGKLTPDYEYLEAYMNSDENRNDPNSRLYIKDATLISKKM